MATFNTPDWSSPQILETWLITQGLDLSTWGHGSAKTVEALWYEIQQNECVLQPQPLLRKLSVVHVIIRRANLVLLEIEQKLKDGRFRKRYSPPGEKVRVGENLDDVAIRCLQEELGIDTTQVSVRPSALVQPVREVDSPSYPGLCSQYHFHLFETTLINLPATDFWTEEDSHNHGELVISHHWSWVSFDSFDSWE